MNLPRSAGAPAGIGGRSRPPLRDPNRRRERPRLQRRRLFEESADSHTKLDRELYRRDSQAPAPQPDQYAGGFRQTDRRRGQRLCGRNRLYHHLLLRSDRRLGSRRMAAAASRAGDYAGAGRSVAGGALDRQRDGDAAGAGVSATGRRSVPHRTRAMAGAAFRSDAASNESRRTYRIAIATGSSCR